MVRNQTDLGPGIVEWSLPEADIGEVLVCVPLREDDLDPDDSRRAWCPVCATSTAMRAARTRDGRRFDLCDDCGLLWHVDRRLGRAVAHRVAVPHQPAHERPEATDVGLRTVQSREGTDDPARRDREAHPLAS
jgi:hypothetical protein